MHILSFKFQKVADLGEKSTFLTLFEALFATKAFSSSRRPFSTRMTARPYRSRRARSNGVLAVPVSLPVAELAAMFDFGGTVDCTVAGTTYGLSDTCFW
jgi:hypothetical protein